MSVSVREKTLKNGRVSFYLDARHDEFKRKWINTGLKADPQKKREYRKARREAEAKAEEMERRLREDPAEAFEDKEKSHSDFVSYFESAAKGRKFPPVWRNCLKHLRDFTGGQLLMKHVNKAWAERFRQYIATLETVNNTTRHNYLVTLKIALGEAAEAGYIRDFASKVKTFKKADPKINFLTVDQIKRLDATPCRKETVKLAFLFGCFTGLRLSDVKKLQFSDIQKVDGIYYLSYKQTKTRQHERAPLSEQAIHYLNQATNQHIYQPEDKSRVFILPTDVQIGKILHQWSEEAGLPFRLHFHVSRHTFAVLALASGVDIYTVSKLLGHADIATTQRYARIVDESKVKAVKLFPVLHHREPESQIVLPPSEVDNEEDAVLIDKLISKGEKIGKALGLKRADDGRFILGNDVVSAGELVLRIKEMV